ncbi:MAG: uroporphyrinogen-III C-methyltransferase [Planctomycetaceae bacterium]|nr:uroporphyrinogen-III C-methyltransferase [Planctomycetaceae bacterium]
MTQDTSSQGFVYLVGAGPGDPSYITLRAVQCLKLADIVLYDYLVNPRILEHVHSGVECICMGRHGVGKLWRQDEINAECIKLAREGLVVVRLKGGDPAIFARAAEEASAFEAAGVGYEIVPGITAALASGTCVGIPLTHRDKASAVALITGHERNRKGEASLDFEALAKFPGTLVFYMGVTTSRNWTVALQQYGMPSDTPVAIVRKISCPEQVTVRCTLGEVAERFEGNNRIRPPAIVIIGDVVGDNDLNSWFEQRPLFGQRILVTRAASQSDEFSRKLSQLGAEVVLQPAIEILPPENYQALDRVIESIIDMKWIVFSSSNGVQYFLNRLLEIGFDTRHLAQAKLAAIGPGTASALEDFNLKADLLPQQYRAESMVEALAPHVAGEKVLLIRASRGRDILPLGLRDAGAEVEQIVVYRSEDVKMLSPSTTEAVKQGIDWVTFTSSAIARSSIGLLGEHLQGLKSVSISPITSETMRGLGFEPTVEAKQYDLDGMIQAIFDYAGS